MSFESKDWAIILGVPDHFKSTGLKSELMRLAVRGYFGQSEIMDPQAGLLPHQAEALQALGLKADTNIIDQIMFETTSPTRAQDTSSYEPHSPFVKAFTESYSRALAMSVRRKEPGISSQEATDIVVTGLRERELAHIALLRSTY